VERRTKDFHKKFQPGADRQTCSQQSHRHLQKTVIRGSRHTAVTVLRSQEKKAAYTLISKSHGLPAIPDGST
jgi:hypothetical protein